MISDLFDIGIDANFRQIPEEQSLEFVFDNSNNRKFECTPKYTSSFELFCLCNPELSTEQCNVIWQYYRQLFIQAKLAKTMLSPFRTSLGEFIGGDISHTKRTIIEGIKLSRYLELMYRVDTSVHRINGDMSPRERERKADHLLGSLPYNNYVSYFNNSVMDLGKDVKPIHPLDEFGEPNKNITDCTTRFDPSHYANRKIVVKSEFSYSHKLTHCFICSSEIGAVQITVERKHSPFLQQFERMINEGVEINVVKSKMGINIIGESSHLHVKNFFLE